MPAQEHVKAAFTFLEQSGEEFEAGDILQGSEKLWGAAAHAAMAAALLRGWSVGSHRNLVDAMRHLSGERNDESLEMGFSLARKFQGNFYGQGRFDPFSGDGSMDRDRELIANHVHKVLGIAMESPSDG